MIQRADPLNVVSWFPREGDQFLELQVGTGNGPPGSAETVQQLRSLLRAAPLGSSFPCRGRNSTDEAWQRGVAIKRSGEGLFFPWADGDTERFGIDSVDLFRLVHFVQCKEHPATALPADRFLSTDPQKVVIIAHGWSPHVGPHYALIRTLEWLTAKQLGWKTVVPDLRPSYEYESSVRARGFRVSMILEELLCLEPKPSKVVLIGHSQGGAASALCCRPRVVRAANIVGLVMLGSEDPSGLDEMDWRPSVSRLEVVHSRFDAVLPFDGMKNLAAEWRASFVEVCSSVPAGGRDAWGFDIHHELLAPDVLKQIWMLVSDVLKNA